MIVATVLVIMMSLPGLALIVGSFAERMKFSAVLLFSALWFTFSYCRSRTWCGSLLSPKEVWGALQGALFYCAAFR